MVFYWRFDTSISNNRKWPQVW